MFLREFFPPSSSHCFLVRICVCACVRLIIFFVRDVTIALGSLKVCFYNSCEGRMRWNVSQIAPIYYVVSRQGLTLILRIRSVGAECISTAFFLGLVADFAAIV